MDQGGREENPDEHSQARHKPDLKEIKRCLILAKNSAT